MQAMSHVQDRPVLTNLGFGTSKLLRLRSSRQRQELLAAAYDLGIRHFDTARSYGLGVAEEELGKFIQNKRENITIATKFGIPVSKAGGAFRGIQSVVRQAAKAMPGMRSILTRNGSPGVSAKDFSLSWAQKSLADSLGALKTDRVDVLFLHEPTTEDMIDSGLEDWLNQLQRDGQLQHFGCSGELDGLVPLKKARPGLFGTLQFQLDVVRDFTQLLEADSSVTAFGPFARSLPTVCQKLESDSLAKKNWDRHIGISTDKESLARLLLMDAFVSYPSTSIIASTTRIDHLEQLVAVANEAVDIDVAERFRYWVDSSFAENNKNTK